MQPDSALDFDALVLQAEQVFVIYFVTLGIALVFILAGEAIIRWKHRSPVEKILRQRRFG